MPENELAEEKTNEIDTSPAADVLIGITGVVDQSELRRRAAAWRPFADADGRKSVAIAYPANGDSAAGHGPDEVNGIRFTPYELPLADPSSLPWVVAAAAQRQLCSLAIELQAKAGLFLQNDLALLQEDILPLFVSPVVEKQCDVVMPVYPSHRFEGLLNHGVLAPLARALYGVRVKYPLAPDVCYSARMFEVIAGGTAHANERGAISLLWPATLASLHGYDVCQVNIPQGHTTQTEGLDLSTVITSLVGAAFAEMETYAPQWQSVRGSQPSATWGSSMAPVSDGEPINVKPLIDSFLLGSQNLQEVWGLVLPPVTLLELRRLGRSSVDSFCMPDALWARIIYDFALAHRLRKINRGHLLGALTPLYLGWVASYVQEVAASSPAAAEQRLERLARAYEENKPYLISRWRWPDRFNP